MHHKLSFLPGPARKAVDFIVSKLKSSYVKELTVLIYTMSKGNFCEKDSDGKFCQGIVPCMKYNLSGSSEDQEECQKETGGFYGQKLHKACKIPKNLNFSGLFIKLSHFIFSIEKSVEIEL